ncbi:Modification methylase SalI [Streptomyces sp. GBA 94-10 4N24]|nr:Modification methylase SalI [Streptomyces sp. GBA 94-10 4N24]UZN59821.1 Modification methylase SalI [Streptomyces sp. GBA 94-10 4N24]
MQEAEGGRLLLQQNLDAERTLLERNKWGQFATPPSLASEIMRYALGLHEGTGIDFLEPSCGSGSFFSALLSNLGDKRVNRAVGFELDERFAKVASDLWKEHGLRVIEGDFTSPDAIHDVTSSLLVANPPYVRHHHLAAEQKRELTARCAEQLGIKPSGLSGLYLYFILLGHRFLRSGAVSAWLIPSEFMDVNYGAALKEYLATRVQLIRIHQYDASEVQFDDALVTSSVVVFKNIAPDTGHSAEFSFGGTLSKPKVTHCISVSGLDPKSKWSRYVHGATSGSGASSEKVGLKLSDFFKIRRGLATGSNSFFIIPRSEAENLGVQGKFLRPILPSPRKLKGDSVAADGSGWPDIPEQLALIDCPLPIEDVRQEDAALAAYLGSANEKVRNGYLVSKRSPWYKQEQREAAPILLTYMGRGKDDQHPLRFILNESNAVATNMYLMLYPTARLQRFLERDPEGLKQVHKVLLAITADDLRGGGRVYGGGLHKMEPKELAVLPADGIAALHPVLLEDAQVAAKPSRSRTLRATETGPSTGDVRAWARKQGMELPDRGRLRPEVWDAWRRAHPAEASPQNVESGDQNTLW